MTGNNGLPQGWDVVTVGDHVKNISLTGKKLKQKEYQGAGKYPVIDQGQLFIGGYTDNSDLALEIKDPVIVFGDHTRVIKYVDFDFVPGADGVKVLKPSEIFFSKLFYYFVQAIQLPDKGYARHYQYLAKAQIPVPPRSEQERIVARIEETFTQLEAGIAELQNAKAQLKRYRAAVLKSAVEGELTREWREAHKSEVEPAEKLLERILFERKSNWEVKGGKGKYKEPVTPNTDSLPELPDGWAWATVEQLGAVGEQPVLTGPFGTNLGREDFIEDGVPVLTIGCLTEKGINLDKAVYISEGKSKELRRYRLREGDLLFSRMASVGRAGYVEKTLSGVYFNYHIMRLRLDDSVLLPKYYFSFVQGSKQVRDYVREVNHGATRDGINTAQLLAMPVAIPPIEEQHQIIAKVERRLSVANEIEKELNGALVRAERLRGAVLKSAFEGRLG
jgi:type I restriction enzyme, S subunit